MIQGTAVQGASERAMDCIHSYPFGFLQDFVSSV